MRHSPGSGCSIIVEDDPDCGVTLYGEGSGRRIQKGGGNYIPDGQSFVLFDVRIGGHWLDPGNMADVGRSLGLNVIPTLPCMTLSDMMDRVESLESAWPNAPLEGAIGRPVIPLYDNKGHRITTKVKVKDAAQARESG